MGRKLTLTGVTISDPQAPKLVTTDPIESIGSLLLIDPTHPAQGWAAGVPVNGAVIPNILKAALSMDNPLADLKGGINDGTKGKLERTAKGGLHGIVSQANALAATDGLRIVVQSAVSSYIIANKAHTFYVSVWDRLTRANPDPGGSTTVEHGLGGSTAAAYALAVARAGQSWAPTAPAPVGSRNLSNTPGPRFANVAKAGDSSLMSISGAGTPIWGCVSSSTYNGQVISTRNGKWPSFVFYRFYVEDLTVSGRSYAEVDAIDFQLYTKEVLTPGGRYYGDTWTDPTTLA